MISLLDDRYQLQVEIARGAIGVVWSAVDATTGGRVAVKTLRPEAAGLPELVAGLEAEAGLLAGLDHPGVARLLDTCTVDGLPALVLELATGGDLRGRLRAVGTFAPAAVAGIGVQVADALAHVHAAGIVHCDVKPANLLIAGDGASGGDHGAPRHVAEGGVCGGDHGAPPHARTVRLADFGVARRVTDPPGTIHATPEYVAPEVAAGVLPDPPADVYALGIVLYELACGRTPFRGGAPVVVLGRHALGYAVAPPGMPGTLWAVIEACLRKEPANRPTAAEVASRLRAAAPALADLPAPPPLPADAVTWCPLASAETVVLPRSADLTWVPPAPVGAGADPAEVGTDRASAQRLMGLPLRRGRLGRLGGAAGAGVAGGRVRAGGGLVGATAAVLVLLGLGAGLLIALVRSSDGAVGRLVVVTGQVDASPQPSGVRSDGGQGASAGPGAPTSPGTGGPTDPAGQTGPAGSVGQTRTPTAPGTGLPGGGRSGLPFGSGLPDIGGPMPTFPGGGP